MDWEKSNEEPLAYTSEDRHWGLVKIGQTWELHFLRSGLSVRKLCVFDSGDVPFIEVDKYIEGYNSKRKAASWSEATIGGKKPGEEGMGGKPIPMQTRGRI